jgi:hypothetical protein
MWPFSHFQAQQCPDHHTKIASSSANSKIIDNKISVSLNHLTKDDQHLRLNTFWRGNNDWGELIALYLRNNQLKLKTSGNTFRRMYGIYLKLIKRN